MSNLTTRAGKGSPLTNNELDANFTNLNSDKVEIGGDLSGTSSAPNVAKIQGRAVSAEAPSIGEKLVWNGTAWEPSTDPTGEPIGHEDKSSSSISFNSGTRTFTISPVAANFVVWCKGVKYTYTSAQTVVIPDTTGLHFIYFNASGVLSTQMSYFTWEEHAPTAYVYWNSTTQQAVYFGDERHGITLDWQTHEYLHRTRGAAIASGFGASGYTTTGAGSTDADAQIDIGGGTFFDEDLQVDIVSTNTPVAGTWQQDLSGPARIPVLYLNGSAWVIDAPTDFPFKVVSGVPQYNLYSGGTWSAAPVANNGYFVSWILATHNLTYPVIAVISQAATNQVSEAEAMTFEGLTLSGFPSVEFRPLYKVIYQHKTSFANNIKASTIAVYDLRSISAAGVAAALVQDHGNLSGLGDDDHAQYLHVSAVRSPSAAVTNSFLPSQASQSGKYLTTDGSNPSWGSIPSGSLTFTGDVTGTGTTGSSTTLTLSNSGAAAGTYTKVTVDAKGRVTTGALIDSSDVTTALGFTPENSANKAVANGYASLDGSGKVPSTQLPSYVDDVIEYANLAAFPATGESGKIYIAIDTAKTYRWSGSAYVEISASPGSTDAVTEGSTNLYFTNARARGAITATGSLSYNNQTGVLSYTQPTLVSTFTNDSNYLTGITGTQVTNALGYIPPQPNGTGATGTWSISISGNAATVSSITSAQVTTALGYTPYNATNPNGYTNNTGTVTSVSGTGTVSGLTLTGSVTSSGSLTLGGTLSLTSGQVTSALGFTPANSISLGNYLPLSGGTMTGVLAFSSSGTAINLAGQTDSIGYNATTNLGTYIKGTGNTYLYGGGEFYDGTASRQILTSGNYSSFTVARAGGSFVGRVVFPSAVFDRPQLPGGILGLDTGDGNFDIWGISRDYYPSHATASSAWGIRWDGDSNQVRFIGAGTTRLAVDLDGGSSGLTWEGNAVLNASNYSSGYFKTVNGSSIIGTGDITVNPTQLNGYSSSSYSGPTSAVKQFFWDNLSANGGQARTFEIARLGVDYNDWNTGIGPFEVELYEAYYSRGLKKKYVIYWGYSNVYGMQLVEYSGNGDNNFQVRIGTPVQVSGDNYYLPVFVDVRYYAGCDVRVTTNRDITASNPPGIGSAYINASPSATNISDFTADSTVNFASTTSVQIGGNQLLHAGNYGSYALPLGGGTLTGGRPIEINTSNGLIAMRGDSGGWSMGTYFRGSAGTIRAGFGAYGGGDSLNYAWIGTAHDSAWMTLTPSAINSAVALQQGGNQVLHAGNYSSYAFRAVTVEGGIVTPAGGLNGAVQGWAAYDGYGAPVPNYGGSDWWVGAFTGGNSTRGFQIAGGYSDSEMYFRKGNSGWSAWRRTLTDANYSSYALPLSGGTITGTALQVGTAFTYDNPGGWNANIVAAGSAHARFRLRATSFSGSGDRETFLWLDNTVSPATGLYSTAGTFNFNGSIGTVQVNGNTILHAGNYASGYLNGTYLRAAGHPGYGSWDTFGNTSQTVHEIYQENFNAGTNTGSSGFPSQRSYSYGALMNFHAGTARAQIYISHAGNDLIYRGGWGTAAWWTWNKVLSDQNYTSYALPISGGSLTGDLQLGANYLRFDQSGVRSWNMRATGGNLDLLSGDGNGSFRYNNGIIVTSNNVGSHALPIGGGNLTGQTTLTAGHTNTRFQLRYNHDGDPNSGGAGYLTLWASEPGITYAYTGIGGNVNIGGQYYGRQSTGQTYGVYIRWDTGSGQTQFWNTTGTPGAIGGHGTLRAFVASDGELYATSNSHKVLHAGNYGDYALPKTGGTMTGNLTMSGAGSSTSIVFGDSTKQINVEGYWMMFKGHQNEGFRWQTSDGSTYTTRMQLTSSALTTTGSFTASGNVTAYSDERVKANWRQLDDGFVAKLASVKSGIYDRTDIDLTQAGVSAQSLRNVLPQTVMESSDGELSVAYGNAALVSAIELAKELVTLKKELAEIKSRLH